eukprot:Skav207962  [mRNA]  locus=scaffold108:592733:595848:+ [translate_table: standard]
MAWIKYVPFFNIFYDIFFNGTPSVDAIKDSLNVQALLSALLIAIVISYPGAFDYDELKEASTRLSKCFAADDSDPLATSNLLQREVFLSTLCLSNNVLMVVLVYLSLSGLKLDDDSAEDRVETIWLATIDEIVQNVRMVHWGLPESIDLVNAIQRVSWRDVGNFIWLGTMLIVVVVLSFTHFGQLKLDEKAKCNNLKQIQVLPKSTADET